MQTILEYLKRRQKQKYLDFPKDLNDAEAIERWLVDNGFAIYEPKGGFTINNALSLGYKFYRKGLFNKDNPNTHWFDISDGKTFIVQIRTTDEFSKQSIFGHPFYKLCEIKGAADYRELTRDKFEDFLSRTL